MSLPQDQRAAPDRAGEHTIPAGQEELVRSMVAPALPTGWAFVRASIRDAEVRAHYRWEGAARVRAELRLAHADATDEGVPVGRFRLRLLAPRSAPALGPLHAALLAAVRAGEDAFVWERAVDPPPAMDPSPATHVTTRWTPEPAAPGPADPGPAAPGPGDPEPAAPDPAEPECLLRAREAFAGGAFDEALDGLLAAAVSATPPEALAALTLRFGMMWALGRYHEGLEALDDAIGRFPQNPSLHGAAAVLRGEMHDAERAATHAREVVDRAGDSPGLLLQAATVLLGSGHTQEARRAADRALAAPPARASAALLLDVANLYRDAGDYAAADALYAQVLALDPSNPAAHLGAGTLCAWRGDAALALAHADSVLTAHPDSAQALCLRGAAAMLAGEPTRALDDLDRATGLDPGDPVAAVWRAEALLRLGRLDEALREARRGGERSDDLSTHVAAQVLISQALLRSGEFPGLPEYVLRPALATLWDDTDGATTGTEGATTDDDVNALESLLTGALERLRGNRSPVATYVRRDGSLVQLAVPPSPRVASKRALWRFVTTNSLGEALHELDRVHAAAPRAAEPYNYRGELFLYVGDAAAARREFEHAIGLYGRSRWAYIGLAGAAVLTDDCEEALARLAEGIERAGAPGPTAFVYRGEALRRLGRAAEARDDLTLAVRRHPGRIGAWVNLALLDADAGDLASAQRTLAVLRRRAPGFVSDAARALGLDPAADPDLDDLTRLLREMLAMLRGNRASSCVTYFTRDGRLRGVPPSSDA